MLHFHLLSNQLTMLRNYCLEQTDNQTKPKKMESLMQFKKILNVMSIIFVKIIENGAPTWHSMPQEWVHLNPKIRFRTSNTISCRCVSLLLQTLYATPHILTCVGVETWLGVGVGLGLGVRVRVMVRAVPGECDCQRNLAGAGKMFPDDPRNCWVVSISDV